MDETVNTPFHKDEDIMELMEMLRSFKERESIHKLGEAVDLVESLENVLTGIGVQLKEMQTELTAVREQNDYLMTRAERTVKDSLKEQVEKAENKLKDLREKVSKMKTSIKQNAHEIVNDVKHTGRKALKNLTDILHIREGLEKVKIKADQMMGELDSLSAKVDGYTQQEHHQAQIRAPYDDKSVTDKGERKEPEGNKPEPIGTYQEEMEKFIDSCVAEGREYSSNAEAYEAFKCLYDKRMEVQGQAEKVEVFNKVERVR